MMRKLNRKSLRTEMLARVRMKALLKRNSRRKRIFDLSSHTPVQPLSQSVKRSILSDRSDT